MLGNAPAVRSLRAWATAWQSSGGAPPRLRAALLEGPPGVGKTTSALALAADMGWSVVEMNASDARNEQAIVEVAGRASLTNTLGDDGVYRGTKGGARTLILLDEADCLTGRITEDSGARPPVTSFREFVRGRYGSVEALARAWKLGSDGAPAPFVSWESVPATAGRGAWTKLAAAQRDIADWRSVGRPRDSSDRGGLGAIARLVRETRQPLLLTVNDAQPLTRYSAVFRQGVARIRFYPVDPKTLRGALEKIVTREKYQLPAGVLESVLQRSQGDVRAALTDLEAVGVLPGELGAGLLAGRRDAVSDFYDFTRQILAEPRFYRSVEVRDRLDVTPDDLFPWLEENVPRAARRPPERSASVDVLAASEHLLARARRQRVWGLWSFASELMTGGAVLAADPGPEAPDLAFPMFLGQMGRTRFVRATRGAVAGKIGHHAHVSRRKAIDSLLPFYERLLREPVGAPPATRAALRRAVGRELGLSRDESIFLTGVEGDDVDPEPDSPPAAESPPSASESKTESPPAERRKVQRRLAEF